MPNGETIVSWYCIDQRIVGMVVRDGEVGYRTCGDGLAHVVDLLERLDAQWHHLHAAALAEHHARRFERACREVLADLYHQLVAPLADLLPDDDDDVSQPVSLVAVLHGPLHQVPVHALFDGDRYLIERFEISITPSLADYLWRSRQKAPDSGRSLVLAVADEQTPAIVEEAHAVASRLGRVTLQCGETATTEEFLRAAPGASIVHLACHALFRADNPLFSSLRLADRWLRADELLGIDLSGALVSLSACDSARSYSSHGEELTGLTRAVLGSGARTLVASLWPADDGATRILMSTFYDHLMRCGAAGALRIAQLAVLAKHPHPYYWAPFVVIGGR